MKVRYYIDPQSDVPHIYGHDVSELEVEEVLERAAEDYAGREGPGRSWGDFCRADIASNLCA